jgi:hypothetical protein
MFRKQETDHGVKSLIYDRYYLISKKMKLVIKTYVKTPEPLVNIKLGQGQDQGQLNLYTPRNSGSKFRVRSLIYDRDSSNL